MLSSMLLGYTLQVQKFFREFCSLMGDHFTTLADKEEKEQSSKASTNAPLISEVSSSSGEEAQMREIISRPQVKDVLSDPVIQQLIMALKEDPNAAQRYELHNIVLFRLNMLYIHVYTYLTNIHT